MAESAAQRKTRTIDGQSADRIARGWTGKDSGRKNREFQ